MAAARAARGKCQNSPELQEFKERLLTLDFYKDIKDDKDDNAEMTPVPLNFETPEGYVKTFLPLFWREARSQIQNCKVLEMNRVPETVQHQAFKTEEEWVKLELQRGKEEAGTVFYSFGDLVLLTQGKDPTKEDPVHFLAMVDMSSGARITVSTKLAHEGDTRSLAVAKVIAAAGSWQLAKVTNLSTLMREHESLSAFPRIYLREAIVNRDDSGTRKDTGTEMQAAPDMQPAATAKAAPPEGEAMLHIPEKLNEWLRATHNEPQAKAIGDCRKVSGITLVQGPPGTGKTKTALGILAVLLNARAKEAKAVSYSRTDSAAGAAGAAESSGEEEEEVIDEEAILKREMERAQLLRQRVPWLQPGFVPWSDVAQREVPTSGTAAWRSPFPKLSPSEVVPMSQVTQDVGPQKVLVCAPSNAAIDEVLRRVVQDGIVGPDGTRGKPSVVRLGPNLHPSLEEWHLEKIVKRRLAARSEAPTLNEREEEKARLLRDARLVTTTLSVSGSRDLVGFEQEFDTCVVDEASQGVEVSMLVPLKLGCRRLILIGDPKQLPATCFSKVALKHDYDRSLFQRLQTSGHKVNLLQVQYRMHPLISSFPSERFYEGELKNALEAEDFERAHPAPWSRLPCFGPLAFFDVKGRQEEMNLSKVNEAEAEFVVQIYRTLAALWPEEQWYSKMAVISPYAEQVKLIRKKFQAVFGLRGKGVSCPVDVNTVDGFQGREKDCIVVSVVRADPKRSIGFVRDKRRMNVAFTRPRTNLWIVGHSKVLSKNEDWCEFIKRQRENARLLRVPVSKTTKLPSRAFLAKYIQGFYERRPEEPRPPAPLPEVEEEELEEERPERELEVTKEMQEEMDRREAEEAAYDRDIEELSQFSQEDEEMEGEDGEPPEEGLEEGEEPAAKRQRTEAAEAEEANGGGEAGEGAEGQ